jgi:protein unc-79
MYPFSKELMYRFVSERFDGTSSTVQEQALSWLQILSELDVSIPINTLLVMFHSGLNSLQKLELRALRRREAYISSLGALGAPTTSNSSNNIASNNFGTNADEDHTALFNLNLNNNPFTVFDTFEAFRAYRNPLMLLQMTGQEVANLIKEEEEDFVVNNSELNITCCIMMLDMILKQIEIQNLTYHLGIYNPISKELLFLLSKHLILPWAKKHKCKQQFGFLSAESVSASSQSHGGSNNCQFCEEYVLWFSFAKDILLFIAPKVEVELPEVNFHQILETISSPTYKSTIRKGYSFEKGSASQDTTQQPNVDAVNSGPSVSGDKAAPKKSESKTDPEIGIWVTSYGVYYFKFSNLGVHLQFFHSLLKSK